MTTATPVRVESFPNIADDPEALSELRSGLLNAETEANADHMSDMEAQFWTPDGGETDALLAWSKVTEAATDEILLDVARLLSEAINRRLPWTWEPER